MGDLYYNNSKTVDLFKVFNTDFNRKKLAFKILSNHNIHNLFVSKFFKNLIEQDCSIKVKNGTVISNYINNEIFSYSPKKSSDRLNILSIRPFNNLNYAGDLIVAIILDFSKKSFFTQLNFHVQGFSPNFKVLTGPLKYFKYVRVCESVFTHEETPSLHKEYGVALMPSRFDTQGVSLCEAMLRGSRIRS